MEDSLRTFSKNRTDDIETRKKKSTEFVLGENLAVAVQSLSCDGKINEHCSPFNTVMERYANFEKTIGHMLATNDQEIAFFLGSDTPLSKLLNQDIPAVNAAKKELDVLTKKHINAQLLFENAKKKQEKMFTEPEPDTDAIQVKYTSEHSVENFIILPSLRFYVKSIFGILEMENLPF